AVTVGAGEHESGVEERISVAASAVEHEGMGGDMKHAVAGGRVKEPVAGGLIAGDEGSGFGRIEALPCRVDFAELESGAGERTERDFLEGFTGDGGFAELLRGIVVFREVELGAAE